MVPARLSSKIIPDPSKGHYKSGSDPTGEEVMRLFSPIFSHNLLKINMVRDTGFEYAVITE